MAAPQVIHRLVETFDKKKFELKNSSYKEAHLRQEFINPFWEALGWDMINRQGLAEYMKEVIHEDSLIIQGSHTAPDYCFRKETQRKFFLEVKAPKVYIKGDPSPAYQLKRYAWNAQLPVSILSDFEEFAVYQCTGRPYLEDKPTKDRIEYLDYSEYIDKWEWLYSTFSREAVWTNDFDTYANTKAKKRGTQSFDKAFLADMLEWRKALAQNIALRNKSISERELNYAVQVTLDRIIFLRIAEDRGIEQYGNLATTVGLDYVINGGTKKRKVEETYKELLKRFKLADDRYNSGLFHFKKEKDRQSPDGITPNLEIDDKTITEIVKQLYYPESPYAFDQVPADVLGSVYEQFLGQVITLSPSHKASIDYKPEVKKAGGVYYTPKYIVDYIVKNTLGKLLDDIWQPKTLNEIPSPEKGRAREGLADLTTKPEEHHNPSPNTVAQASPPVTPSDRTVISTEPSELANERMEKSGSIKQPPTTSTHFNALQKKARALTVLDPACGSGSFLLGAYQYLLDWYHKFYVETDPTYWLKTKVIEPLPSPKSSPSPEKERAGERLAGDDSLLDQNTAPRNYRLTISERKRILLAHIHGVDIDSQAVEVAKLNLLLKASEGGTPQQAQIVYDPSERLLPDLEKNIVCGNSLVEWDITKIMKLTREDEERIKPFSFSQAFPAVMKSGGFDAVMGNPPYVRQELLGQFREYFQRHFTTYHTAADLYTYFIERAYSLLKTDGQFGYIVANKWMRSKYGEPLRKWLKLLQIDRIVDFGTLQIFAGATTYTCIISLSKNSTGSSEFLALDLTGRDQATVNEAVYEPGFTVSKASLNDSEWTLRDDVASGLLEKLSGQGKTLSEYVERRIYRGILTGLNEAFVIDTETRNSLVQADRKSEEVIVPFLTGRDVKRYLTPKPDKFLILFRSGWTNQQPGTSSPWRKVETAYPAIASFLKPFEVAATKRCDQGQYWWELRACDYYDAFAKPKIIVPAIVSRASYAPSNELVYSNDKTSIVSTDDLFLLGVLNSKAADYFIKSIASTKQGGFFEFKPMYVERVPIPDASNEEKEDLRALVRQIVTVRGELSEQNSMKGTVTFLEDQVDRLVYRLYDLTEEEIQIVEDK